jgi:hypothetical protein
LRMIKIKRSKKNQEKKLKYSQMQTRLNLDYLFPGNGARKRGLLMVDCCIMFVWTCKRTSPPS